MPGHFFSRESISFNLGVHVFTERFHYSDTFGLQWKTFSSTQIDSEKQSTRSRERFFNETGWSIADIESSLVLDAGCGAGRFVDISLGCNANVVAVDASVAVYEVANRFSKSNNLTCVRADLSDLPFHDDSFDFVYCIGVLQHTSDPKLIFSELTRVLKPGGELTITFYESRGIRTRLYSKYLIRPVTKRVTPEKLLNFLRKTSFFWFPITRFLFALPYPLGKFFSFIIPVANYPTFKYTNIMEAREESILDTFDMLSPQFDRPLKKGEIRDWANTSSVLSELPVNPKIGTLKFFKNKTTKLN